MIVTDFYMQCARGLLIPKIIIHTNKLVCNMDINKVKFHTFI